MPFVISAAFSVTGYTKAKWMLPYPLNFLASQCPACGKTYKTMLPEEERFDFGPRLNPLIAELNGIKTMSNKDLQHFCLAVFGLQSVGTIQKFIDIIDNYGFSAAGYMGTLSPNVFGPPDPQGRWQSG